MPYRYYTETKDGHILFIKRDIYVLEVHQTHPNVYSVG